MTCALGFNHPFSQVVDSPLITAIGIDNNWNNSYNLKLLLIQHN
jgi:hypothetical protein